MIKFKSKLKILEFMKVRIYFDGFFFIPKYRKFGIWFRFEKKKFYDSILYEKFPNFSDALIFLQDFANSQTLKTKILKKKKNLTVEYEANIKL